MLFRSKGHKARGVFWTKPDASGKEVVRDEKINEAAYSEFIEDYKNTIDAKNDPVKSIILSVKDLAYNPNVKAVIAFSNSGSTAKLVSALRPSVKIITISPNINVSRQLALIWGVESVNSRDAKNWNDMMNIAKEIVKKDKAIKRNDYVIITLYAFRYLHYLHFDL